MFHKIWLHKIRSLICHVYGLLRLNFLDALDLYALSIKPPAASAKKLNAALNGNSAVGWDAYRRLQVHDHDTGGAWVADDGGADVAAHDGELNLGSLPEDSVLVGVEMLADIAVMTFHLLHDKTQSANDWWHLPRVSQHTAHHVVLLRDTRIQERPHAY